MYVCCCRESNLVSVDFVRRFDYITAACEHTYIVLEKAEIAIYTYVCTYVYTGIM